MGVWGGLENCESSSGEVGGSAVDTLSVAELQRCFIGREIGGDFKSGFEKRSFSAAAAVLVALLMMELGGRGEEKEGVFCLESDSVDSLASAGVLSLVRAGVGWRLCVGEF